MKTKTNELFVTSNEMSINYQNFIQTNDLFAKSLNFRKMYSKKTKIKIVLNFNCNKREGFFNSGVHICTRA